jgi:hypothetical protein
VLAGDDELAPFTIDVAQGGFGGGNAVEANLAFGELDVHGGFSWSAWKGEASRQLDQS